MDRNELLQIMSLLESNVWTDEELDNLLIEYRYKITEAKNFYLVCIVL